MTRFAENRRMRYTPLESTRALARSCCWRPLRSYGPPAFALCANVGNDVGNDVARLEQLG